MVIVLPVTSAVRSIQPHSGGGCQVACGSALCVFGFSENLRGGWEFHLPTIMP
jgi:hypothetical protein